MFAARRSRRYLPLSWGTCTAGTCPVRQRRTGEIRPAGSPPGPRARPHNRRGRCRAQGGQDVLGLRAVGLAHGLDGLLQDPFLRAPPAAMDGGHGPVLLVDEKDGKAVRRTDDEEKPGDIGHQGVALELLSGASSSLWMMSEWSWCMMTGRRPFDAAKARKSASLQRASPKPWTSPGMAASRGTMRKGHLFSVTALQLYQKARAAQGVGPCHLRPVFV